MLIPRETDNHYQLNAIPTFCFPNVLQFTDLFAHLFAMYLVNNLINFAVAPCVIFPLPNVFPRCPNALQIMGDGAAFEYRMEQSHGFMIPRKSWRLLLITDL